MVHGHGQMDLLGTSPTGCQGSQVIQMKDGSGCKAPMQEEGRENGMMAVNHGQLELMATSVKNYHVFQYHLLYVRSSKHSRCVLSSILHRKGQSLCGGQKMGGTCYLKDTYE